MVYKSKLDALLFLQVHAQIVVAINQATVDYNVPVLHLTQFWLKRATGVTVYRCRNPWLNIGVTILRVDIVRITLYCIV